MPFGIDPNYTSLATDIATKAGISPAFVLSIMSPESAGDPNATSSKGARGLMQLMPDTAKGLGVTDPTDPVQNITGGVNYIKQLAGRFGDNPRLVAAAYNAGEGAVSRSLAATGDIPNYPETRGYVNKVTTNLAALQVPGQPAAAKSPASDPGLNPSDFTDVSPDQLKSIATKSTSVPATKSGLAPGADSSLDPSDFADVSQSMFSRGPGAAAATPAAPDKSIPTIGSNGQPVTTPAAPITPLKQQLADVMSGKQAIGGFSMQDPATATNGLGNAIGRTARDAMQGAGAIADIPSQAVVAPYNAATGSNVPSLRTLASNAADAIGLPKAQGVPDRIAESMVGAGGMGAMANLARGAVTAGAPVLSNVLGELGSNIGGQVAGAATGTAAGAGVDKLIGDKVTPGARMALDAIAGIAGGAPVAGATNAVNSLRGGAPIDSIAEMAANGNRTGLINASAAAKSPLSIGEANGPQSVAAGLEKVNNLIPGGGKSIAAGAAEQQIKSASDALSTMADSVKPNNLPAGSTAGSVQTDRLIANDLRTQYKAAKNNASAAYDAVPVALAKSGVPDAVPLDATRQAALDLNAAFPKGLEELSISAPLKAKLDAIIGATDPAPLTILGANGKPMKVDPAMQAVLQKMAAQGRATSSDGSPLFGGPTVHSFDDARDLQQGIGQLLSSAEQKVKMGGSPVLLGKVTQLYNAVKTDVDGFVANASPEAKAAYDNANNIFKSQVLPFRADPRVRSLVSGRTSAADYDLAAQGIGNNLFNSSQSERAPYAMSLLSKNGQDAAAYAVLKKAADAATSPNSPQKFRPGAGLKGLDPENDPALAAVIAAHPDLKAQIGSVRALIGQARNAAQTLSNPKTGAQLLLPYALHLMAGAGGYGAGAAAGHGIAPWIGSIAAPAALVALSRAAAKASYSMPKSLLSMDPGTLGQAVLPSMRGGLLGQP